MPAKTIRAVALAILFLVALALAFLSFALLLLAVVLCIFFALLAFLAAPEETKAFVRGSRDTVDAWVRAMVKLVEDAGRMMEAWMARFAGGAAQAAAGPIVADSGELSNQKAPQPALFPGNGRICGQIIDGPALVSYDDADKRRR